MTSPTGCWWWWWCCCCWCWVVVVVAAAAAAVPTVFQDDGKNDNEDNYEEEDDGEAGPLPGVLLVLPGGLQLIRPAPDERAGPSHLALDVVKLLALLLHQHGHVQEHLVQLRQAPLDLLGRVVAFLDLRDGVENPASPLLLYRLLKEGLALAGRDQHLHGTIVGILAGDGEVAALYGVLVLGGDAVAQEGELLHAVGELLAEAGDDGGAGAVGGAAGAAAGLGAVGSVGAVEGLELDLDELGALEGVVDVGVHARAEVLDRSGVVEGLARLIRLVQPLVDLLDLSQLVFDRFHVFEELV